MAAIKKQVIAIQLNKLVRVEDDGVQLITDDLVANIEAIVQELVGDSIIVEVITD